MKVVWTEFAIESLNQIFDYYSEKASKKVAKRIKEKILNSTKQLIKNQESGQIELNLEELKANHRYLVIGYHKIIYRIEEEYIIINDVFDTRQDPKKMNRKSRLEDI